MGCVSLKKERLSPILPQKSANGLLKVTIQEANILKPPSKLFSLDPYLKIRMSNQQYQGFIHKKAGRFDLFNETFQFIINSCYKSQGRFVCIEVWDKHMLGDRIIGTGTIDIDPILNFDEKNMLGSQALQIKNGGQNNDIEISSSKSRICQCKRKLFLSHGVQQAGYLNVKFEFIEQSVTVVGFKFIYANLRRNSSIFTTMHIRIQVTAGEQVLTTYKHKDKDTKNPPSWQDEILMFNIPTSLKQCIIRVLDNDEEVGRYKLQFLEIIGQKGEHKFTQQLQSDHRISGVIKFIALVGVTSIANDSSKILQMQEFGQRIKTQIQPSIKIKLQLPSQKQTKLYESQEKTNFQTQANQEQQSKNNTNNKQETSILFIDQHQLRH